MIFIYILVFPVIVAGLLFAYFIFNQNLKSSSWHARLFSFIWGVDVKRSFSWMCPYAWAQFFTISLIVPILTTKLISKVIGWCLYSMSTMIEEKVDTIREQKAKAIEAKTEYWVESCNRELALYKEKKIIDSKSILASFIRYIVDEGDKRDFFIGRKIHHFIDYDQYKEFHDMAWEIYHNEKESLLEIQPTKPLVSMKTPRLKLPKISIDTEKQLKSVLISSGKFLGKLILILVVGLFIFGLYQGVIWLSQFSFSISTFLFMRIMAWIVVLVSFGFCVFTLIDEIVYAYSKLSGFCLKCAERSAGIQKFFRWVSFYLFIPFIYLGKWIVTFFKFLGYLFRGLKNFKDDNCPAINWDANS